MKVLGEGKWKKPWSMEVVCAEKDCEALLLIEVADVSAVDNSSPASYSSVCMVCNSKIHLKSSSVPKWVKNASDSKKKYWSSGSWD